MVLACQTASQLLGMDCQYGMPRQAAIPMKSAPKITPAATVRAGHNDTDPEAESASRYRASRIRKPNTTAVTMTRASSAVQAFQPIPIAPNGMMARPTTPYVNTGPTPSATGQLSRPATATTAPGRISNKTAIISPNAKLTGLVWLPR